MNALFFLVLLGLILAVTACISSQEGQGTATPYQQPPLEPPTRTLLAPTVQVTKPTSTPEAFLASQTSLPTAGQFTETPGSEEGTPAADLSALPITFPVTSAEMAEYFNQIARPEDIALLPNGNLSLLPKIEAGQVRVSFASWAEAERELPGIADQIEVVAYNPEHWDLTPAAEQENLPATVAAAAKVARDGGVKLMVTPDRRFAKEHLAEIVPHVDMIGLQGQRLQDNPQAFADWAHEMIQIVKANNSEAEIIVQVGATQGPATEMLAAIQTVAGMIDGISIWATPTTLETLKEFIALIRPAG